MFCNNCGTNTQGMEGAFCNNCGAKREGAAAPAPRAVTAGPSPSGLSFFQNPKNRPLIFGGLVLIVIAIIFAVNNTGGDNVRGTWESTATTGTWRGRIEINRNGTGEIFEINADTGVRRNTVAFSMETTRRGGDNFMIIEIDASTATFPNDFSVGVAAFEITQNLAGDRILRLRDIDNFVGMGRNWQDFRRV